MIGLSFIAMFGLMYAMVDVFANVFVNLNQVYMAGLMAAPMVLIELVVMRSMYQDRKMNMIFAASAIAVLVLCWVFIRAQTAVSDRQFMRSMIPHHASAILMCQQASIQDPAIRKLCGDVISSQQAEIEVMKALLAQPGK